MPLRSTSLRAIPVCVKPYNRAAPPLPNECPSREWNPRRSPSNSADSNIGTGPSHGAPFPLARASRPSPGSCWYFGEEDGLRVIGESLVFTLIVVLLAERVAHTLPCPRRRLPRQTQLNQRPAKHLSTSTVDRTTQWRHIDMAHSCSKTAVSLLVGMFLIYRGGLPTGCA